MLWVFPPQSVKLCVYVFLVRETPFMARETLFWNCAHTIFWYVKRPFSFFWLVITPPCTVLSTSAQILHVWYFLYSPLRLQDFWRIGLVLTPSDSVRCFWEPNCRKWSRLINLLFIFLFLFIFFPLPYRACLGFQLKRFPKRGTSVKRTRFLTKRDFQDIPEGTKDFKLQKNKMIFWENPGIIMSFTRKMIF